MKNVLLKQSSHNPLDWRYVHKVDGHSNVYQIGRIVAATEQEAERKAWFLCSKAASTVCVTPVMQDVWEN